MMPVSPIESPVPQNAAVTFSGLRELAKELHDIEIGMWIDWAKYGDKEELRREAVFKVDACLSDRTSDLDLSHLCLSDLPSYFPMHLSSIDLTGNCLTRLEIVLPAGLLAINLNQNRLEVMPVDLPDKLELFFADDNCLTTLPETLPASLEIIAFNRNRVTRLPAHLPLSLTSISAASNCLCELPAALPASLLWLDVSKNKLTAFPSGITTLTSCSSVILHGNFFTKRVLFDMRVYVSLFHQTGPHIIALPEFGEGIPNLPSMVSDWYPADRQVVQNIRWMYLPPAPGMPEFRRFLIHLAGSVNAACPEFKQFVGQWLSELLVKPRLRGITFDIAEGATASCEDRISLTFNEMQKARMLHDVENGKYDEHIPDLIACARNMFRQEYLEQISMEKIETLNRGNAISRDDIDQIGIFLAYQVKLRLPLKLSSPIQDMRYFSLSYITSADLELAEKTVKQKENAEFSRWLADWTPWQCALQRLFKPGYDLIRDCLYEHMDDPLQRRITAELQSIGLQNDDDAARAIGARIAGQVTERYEKILTDLYLLRQDMTHLLDPVWPAVLDQADAGFIRDFPARRRPNTVRFAELSMRSAAATVRAASTVRAVTRPTTIAARTPRPMPAPRTAPAPFFNPPWRFSGRP